MVSPPLPPLRTGESANSSGKPAPIAGLHNCICSEQSEQWRSTRATKRWWLTCFRVQFSSSSITWLQVCNAMQREPITLRLSQVLTISHSADTRAEGIPRCCCLVFRFLLILAGKLCLPRGCRKGVTSVALQCRRRLMLHQRAIPSCKPAQLESFRSRKWQTARTTKTL